MKGKRVRAETEARRDRVKLPSGDYWQFRSSLNEVNAIELEAVKAAAAYRQRIAAAEQKTRELFARLGKAHGFDPQKHYGWDDATCELIPIAST
jgi:hypothetical protein